MKSLVKLWRRSLLVQMVSYFLLISLLTVSWVGYLAYISARQTLTQAIYNQLGAEAAVKDGELDRWANNARQNLLFISQSPDVQNMVATYLLYKDTSANSATANSAYGFLTQYLISAVTAQPDLQEVFILSSDGKIIFSTNKAHEGEIHATDQFFVEGQRIAYMSNVYNSSMIKGPTMTVAVPLLDRTNHLVGVLAGHLDLERMDRTILQTVGQGEAYAVDAQGSFVSALRFGRADTKYITTTVGIQSVVAGKTGYGLYANYKGVPVVGIYRWVPAHQVGLLAEISQAEAFAPATQLGLIILIVGLLSAVVMAAGVFWLAQRITSPIVAITRAAQAIAGGDLNIEAPVLTQNEVGTLARTFNQMTAQDRHA